MARRLVLEIAESAEYLEKSLKQAKSAAQKERLQMLWWLKTGRVLCINRIFLNSYLDRSKCCLTMV
jgi:hypothetical protein